VQAEAPDLAAVGRYKKTQATAITLADRSLSGGNWVAARGGVGYAQEVGLMPNAARKHNFDAYLF
jgi:hypothetical protein